MKKRQLVIFREPQETEYASKSTLSNSVVYPLAFPELAVEINRIISK